MARLFLTELSDRSPQFELKLLTKFLLVPRTTLITTNFRENSRHATLYAIRIQPDCQTSAHITRDFAKANYMPASKAVRPQPTQPWTKIQPVTGRFDYNQKIGRSERTSSERGLSGLQSEELLKKLPCTASCCQPYPNYASVSTT